MYGECLHPANFITSILFLYDKNRTFFAHDVVMVIVLLLCTMTVVFSLETVAKKM